MGGKDQSPLAARKYTHVGARLLASLSRNDMLATIMSALAAVSEMAGLELKLQSHTVDVHPSDTLAHPSRGDACFVILARPGGGVGAELMIEVPCPLALLLTDRALGSSRVRIPASRSLSDIERGVLAYVAAEAALHFERGGWRVVSCIDSRSTAATTWGHTTELGLIDVGVRLGNIAVRASAWLSPRTVEHLIDVPQDTALGGWGDLAVPCAIEVGHSWLSAHDIEHLTPGWGAPLDDGPRLTSRGAWWGDLFLCAVQMESLRWRCHWTRNGWRIGELTPTLFAPTIFPGSLRVSARLGECSPALTALRYPGRAAPFSFGRDLAPEVSLYVGEQRFAKARLLSLRGQATFRVEERC